MAYTVFSLASLEPGGPIQALAAKFGVSWPLLIAQGINFCIVVFLLYRFAFKPIISTLDTRQKQIEEGLTQANEARDQLIKAKEEAKAITQNAAKEAGVIVQEAKDASKRYLDEQIVQTHATVEAMLEKAKTSIQAQHEAMLNSLKSEVAGLVAQTSAKVLGKTLSEVDRSTYMQEATQTLHSLQKKEN